MADETSEHAELAYGETVQLATHLRINRQLSGEITELTKNFAKVTLVTSPEMAADELGLVHGGFIFGAADFAAMAAVNEPNVVLAEATTKFLAPIEVGKRVDFEATCSHDNTRTRFVNVTGRIGDIKVFEGEFKTVILDSHALRLKLTD
jgi:acyl-coenzyme A thioesterase PaaI-like protein